MHKQHLLEIASERNSFINSSDKLKMMHEEHFSESNHSKMNKIIT